MALKKTQTRKKVLLSDLLAQGKSLKDIDVSKTYSVYADDNFKKPITDIQEGFFNKISQTHLYHLSFERRSGKEYAPRWIVTELKQLDKIIVIQYWFEDADSKTGWSTDGWIVKDTGNFLEDDWEVIEYLETDKYGNPCVGIAKRPQRVLFNSIGFLITCSHEDGSLPFADRDYGEGLCGVRFSRQK